MPIIDFRKICFTGLVVIVLLSIIEKSHGFSHSVFLDSKITERSRISSNTSARTCPKVKAASTGLDVESLSQRSIRSRISNVMGNFRQKVNINVQIVEDLEEFKQIISDEQQAAVAVMFYSPVCKACKTSKPLFNKLAKKYTDVKFISVPMTKAQVWESINVPTKYPFGHIYDQNGALVNEVGLLRKLIPKFEESLQSFVAQQDNNDDENR